LRCARSSCCTARPRQLRPRARRRRRPPRPQTAAPLWRRRRPSVGDMGRRVRAKRTALR
jgi:hypothetical protein